MISLLDEISTNERECECATSLLVAFSLVYTKLGTKQLQAKRLINDIKLLAINDKKI